ncbi:MAG TPA: ABC transporter permease [Streptosporangiaceae bacterium]|nr:ABC transporter permease [Streptosporangiaceae bacterium]
MTQATTAGTGPARAGERRDERPGLCRLARDSLLIAGRYQRVLRGSPGRLIYPLLQPVLILVLFVSVMQNLTSSVAGGSYRQFLIPGIMIQNVVLTAPVTGLAIVRDAGTGLADRFRSLPMPRSAALIGRSVSDTVVFLAQALVMIGVGYLLGFRVHTGLAGAAGIALVAVAFGTALGITCAWLALLIRDVETAERALFFPFIPLAFVSSAYAPAGRLAGWMQPVARVNPVSAAAAVLRALADGGPLAVPVLHLAAWIAVLAVVPGVLAVRRWQAAA